MLQSLSSEQVKRLLADSSRFQSELSVRTDSNSAAISAALPTVFTQVMSEIIETEYQPTPFANGEVIKVVSQVDPAADTAYYMRTDGYGQFGLINNNPTQLNQIETGEELIPYKTQFYGAQFELSMLEQIRGKDRLRPGLSVESRKLSALNTAAKQTQNEIFALGDGPLPGLLNHFDIPRVTLPYRLDNRPVGGVVSTDQQKLDGLMLALNVYVNNAGAFQANAFAASASVCVDLRRPRIGSTNSTTGVWAEFIASYPQFAAKGMVQVPQCIGAGSNGYDVMMIYNDAPSVVRAEYTLPLTILPYEVRALGVLAYGVFGVGGVHALRPAACLIVEMPPADNA
jgi:hypothetical protein